MKTQFGEQVKIFRSDNGTEFFNSSSIDLFTYLVLFIKVHMFTHLSRMDWLRKNISIFSKLLELFDYRVF